MRRGCHYYGTEASNDDVKSITQLAKLPSWVSIETAELMPLMKDQQQPPVVWDSGQLDYLDSSHSRTNISLP